MTLRIIRGGAEDDSRLRATYGDLMRDAPDAGPHPDEEHWLRLSCNELDEPARARLAAHVVSCAECARVYRGVMELLRNAANLDDRAPRPATVARPRPPLAQMALAMAATLAILVTGALMVRTMRGGSSPAQQASTQALAPSPSAPAASAEPAAMSKPRGWALNVQVPDVTLPAGLALQMRGGQADARRFLEEFGGAMRPFRAGQYSSAATLLDGLSKKYPERDAAHFYLGVAHLFAGRPAEAIEPLASARPSETYGDAAAWFSAVALERSGEPAAADLLLAGLCDRDGPYRASACAARQTLAPSPAGAPR
jgi:hypothetical protein